MEGVRSPRFWSLVDGGLSESSSAPPPETRQEREVNRTAETKRNERVVSGYLVNVWSYKRPSVGADGLSGC